MRLRIVRLMWGLLLFSALATGPVLAEGKVSGRVTALDGAPLGDIRLVLVPEDPQKARLKGSTNKKGEFFFGFVSNGKYEILVDDPKLAPHSLKVLVYDTEKHQQVLNYSGPPSPTPTYFDVDLPLKVTYDIVLGPVERSPLNLAKMATGMQSTLEEIAALMQRGAYGDVVSKIDSALTSAPKREELVALPPDDSVRLSAASLYYSKGYAMFRLRDPLAAQEAIRTCLELNPEQPWARFILGAILNDEGKRAEALAEFERESRAGGDKAAQVNSLVFIGRIQRDLQKWQESAAAFEKALEIDPTQAEAYSFLSEIYLSQGLDDKAKALEERRKSVGVQTDPNDAKVAFNAGANYWNRKDYAKAEEFFRKAVETDPTFALAWKSLGYSLLNLGRTQDAITALRKYLELDPKAEDSREIKEILETLVKN